MDERQHCFLMQTVGRESRYFSMETRQDLLRLESAWHRAVCQAVSSLRVSKYVCILAYSGFFFRLLVLKPTVFGVFQDLKFKISEGSNQNW